MEALSAKSKTLHLVGGKVVDTFRPAAAAPLARKVKASAAKRSASAPLVLAEAASAPGLRYTVQTSVDGGQTWETQAVGLQTRKFKLNSENFGDAATLKVRVIATNGFDSTVLSTEDVKL